MTPAVASPARQRTAGSAAPPHASPISPAAELAPASRPDPGPQRGLRHLARLLVACGLLVMGFGIGHLSGVPAAPVAAPAPAHLRLAHLAAGTPAMDATATAMFGSGNAAAEDLAYPGLSPYLEVEPGAWRVEFRPAGFLPQTPPVLSAEVQVEPGRTYTVAAAGLQPDLRLQSVEDAPGQAAPDSARIRLLNLMSGTGLELRARGLAHPAPAVGAGSAGEYVDVAPGPLAGFVSAPGKTPVAVSGTLGPGCAYSAVVVDAADLAATHVVQDSCALPAATARPTAGAGMSPLVPLGAGAALFVAALALHRRLRAAPVVG